MSGSTFTFDFTSYLTTILSITPSEVDVHVLAGGYTNLTARATFSRPRSLPTHMDFPGTISSVILKKATPYMHAFPSHAVPIERQTVEARALRILRGAEPQLLGVADALARVPALAVPQLVFHDVDQNILWMTDLGDGKMLTDYILSNAPSPSKAEELADALGQFVAGLHRATKNPSPETVSTLSDSLHVMSFLTSDATRVIQESPEWEKDRDGMQSLIDRMDGILDRDGNPEPCLGMVDFWPGSALISADEKLSLLDWEYFGLSDPGCELGLFVGHLHLSLLLGEAGAQTMTAVRAFVTKLARTYFGAVQNATSTCFKRRFLIAHGRELIAGPGLFVRTFDAASTARSVEAGLQCLRAAGPEDGPVDYDILKKAPPDVVEGIMSFLEPAT